MRRIVLVTTGVLILLGGIAHWVLGLPSLRAELEAGRASEGLRSGATAVWTFTSGAMLTFGAIVIHAGVQLGKGHSAAGVPVRWIALFYVIFGVAAFLRFHHDLHFAAFAVLGLIAGSATFGPIQAKPAG